MIRLLSVALCLISLACNPAVEEGDYVADLKQYRSEREARLTRESGWLSLIDLHWLDDGETRFGQAEDNAIVLPDGPASAGVFHYDGEQVRLVAAADAGITIEGEPVIERTIAADEDELRLGRLYFYVIARNGRHGVRVKDPESSTRTAFPGLEFFPVDRDYRVEGRLERFDEPQTLTIETMVGSAEMPVPGTLVFTLAGKELRIKPFGDPTDEQLWLIFKDGTSGEDTYPAGRYLYADVDGDRVIIDFNRAYNPPCAFTKYATCPLPPRENWLDPRIEAGERYTAH